MSQTEMYFIVATPYSVPDVVHSVSFVENNISVEFVNDNQAPMCLRAEDADIMVSLLEKNLPANKFKSVNGNVFLIKLALSATED